MAFKTKEERLAYDRTWNAKNRERKRAINKAALKRIKEWYRSLKTKCSNCLENDPDCLDWHHLDPFNKKWTPGRMPSGLGSKKAILEELSKCQLLCANCHRKEEARKRRAGI